ncbi:hypothetical protein XENOCAPTIV_008753 [Xenoophorus captivus]|uniref:Uncharacterized protein n=1 Tax=Xenoophorus captivus TaxID=1517983 RepID=A0ABV0RPH4_9TELE
MNCSFRWCVEGSISLVMLFRFLRFQTGRDKCFKQSPLFIFLRDTNNTIKIPVKTPVGSNYATSVVFSLKHSKFSTSKTSECPHVLKSLQIGVAVANVPGRGKTKKKSTRGRSELFTGPEGVESKLRNDVKLELKKM